MAKGETAIAQPPKYAGIDKWEVENAARTLEEAQEIALKPKLLAAARKMLRFQQRAKKKAIDWAEKI